MKLIPFYAEKEHERMNGLYFIDKKTGLTYKGYPENVNQQRADAFMHLFLIPFVSLLKGYNLHFSNILSLIITIIVCASGYVFGKYMYKRYSCERVNEVYLSKETLREYIIKGKKPLVFELWIITISLIVAIIVTVIFFLTSSLRMLVILFLVIMILTLLLLQQPIDRYLLYKNTKKEGVNKNGNITNW